jgi:hypothetical protein
MEATKEIEKLKADVNNLARATDYYFTIILALVTGIIKEGIISEEALGDYVTDSHRKMIKKKMEIMAQDEAKAQQDTEGKVVH